MARNEGTSAAQDGLMARNEGTSAGAGGRGVAARVREVMGGRTHTAQWTLRMLTKRHTKQLNNLSIAHRVPLRLSRDGGRTCGGAARTPRHSRPMMQMNQTLMKMLNYPKQ